MVLEDLINRVVKEKVSSFQFEKIKDFYADIVYMRTIYEEIRDNKIIVNTKRMFKDISNSKLGIKRAIEHLTDSDELESLSKLNRINNEFLKSFKRPIFSDSVTYNPDKIKPVIQQCNSFLSVASMRLDSNQVREIERVAGVKYGLRKKFGGFNLFI